MSLWSPAVYYLWTVTIHIYDVWTLHTSSKAWCSTHVPVCYQHSANPYVAVSVIKLYAHGLRVGVGVYVV